MTFNRPDALRSWAVAAFTVNPILAAVAVRLYLDGTVTFDLMGARLFALMWVFLHLFTLIGVLALSRQPSPPRRESPDLYVYDAEDEYIGGDFVTMEATATHRQETRRPAIPIPADLRHNGVLLLPRFAKAILDHPQHSTSRDDVFFTMDCNGDTVPDTEATRRFHARFKDMLRAAELCIPVGGGGVRPNRDGLRVLRVTANEGRAGLVRELDRLATAGLYRTTPRNRNGAPNGETGVPTETRNVRG